MAGWKQSEDAPQAAKDLLTRLLDLMPRETEYTEIDEAEHGDRVWAGDIYEAYRLVTEFAEPCRNAIKSGKPMLTETIKPGLPQPGQVRAGLQSRLCHFL